MLIEHAAGDLLVARDECVLREHHAPLAIAGLGERDGDHAPAVEVGDRPHLHLQHQHVAGALEAVRRHLQHAEIALVGIDRGDDLLRLGRLDLVARPVKVENTCLLNAPVKIMSGLPPLVQIDCSTVLSSRLGESALRAVGAGAGAVGRGRVGGAAGRALRRVGLDPGEHRGGLAGGRVVAGVLRLVGAAENRLHVALELETLEHLLIGELVVAAGVIDGALGAGDAGDLVADLADVAEPHGRGDGVGRGVVAFELRVGVVGRGERLRLPFVIDGGRLLALARRS